MTDPYSKPLTAVQAAHLLRRTLFGAIPEHIKALTGQTAEYAVKRLLADPPPIPPPIDPATARPFHDQPFDNPNAGKLTGYVKSWWMAQLVNQPLSLLEKMTLFWSNHFVTSTETVNDYRYNYRYQALLRRHALGNFRHFVIDITQEPAMLRYLNGAQNVLGKPNENYARELQELFTVGRNGGYTEADVQTAAKVLTGWADSGYRNETTGVISSAFRPKQHDASDKVFSAAYGNTRIKGRSDANAGIDELTELVDMLLRNPETARFICRKLYRFFINSDITPAVETNFIVPLAQVFTKSNYELKPVLSTLFQSVHFFDAAIQGAIIKSPVDLIVGAIRFWGSRAPDPAQNATGFYQFGNYLVSRAKEEQQDLLNPPTVFGWTAYYQTGYYQQWINATTLGFRNFFADSIINGAFKIDGKPLIDPLAAIKAMANAEDPAQLVRTLLPQLIAVPLNTEQTDFLIDTVLLNGLPRYEWTAEWNDYVRNPGDPAKRQAVQMKLQSFLAYVFRMAEYQVG